jgi:hypothetical protein
MTGSALTKWAILLNVAATVWGCSKTQKYDVTVMVSSCISGKPIEGVQVNVPGEPANGRGQRLSFRTDQQGHARFTLSRLLRASGDNGLRSRLELSHDAYQRDVIEIDAPAPPKEGRHSPRMIVVVQMRPLQPKRSDKQSGPAAKSRDKRGTAHSKP